MAAPTARRPRSWPFALFLVFVIAYNLFRVALFAMTQTGAITTERPLDPFVDSIVVSSELAIGLVGLIAVPGLIRSTGWGFWLTVAVNVYAIVFDAAAAVGVQLSAAGGVIPPLVILIGLVLFRSRLFPVKTPSAAPSPADV